MPSRSDSKKARLSELLKDAGVVDAAAWAELKRHLAPVSDSYLRRLLKASGYPMTPEIEGVNTKSLHDLERTLTALEREYGRNRTVRSLVIEAKNHVRWAIRRADDADKQEMLLWIMTWLENPELFSVWVEMRKFALARGERARDEN